MPHETILELKGLCLRYGENVLFDNAALQLGEGERLGIYAENGTGKTTLFRVIAGLEKAQAMRLRFLGTECTKPEHFRTVRRQLGYVLQNPENQLLFPEVLEDVMFGPANLGVGPQECYERAKDALTRLGIAALRHALCETLSGGQKRLVSIAGILAMQPKALLLDEPTNALDSKGRDLLAQTLISNPAAQIIVSHDKAFLQALCSRALTIRDKLLVDYAL